MAGLFGRLFGPSAHPADDPEILAAIDRAVGKVEPRLRQVGGYPDRYRRAVASALDYARHLSGAVPGPVEMSVERYAAAPLVRALFSSPHEMQHALCMSSAMHVYSRRPEGVGDTVYALMGMRRQVKAAFGVEANGDLISREVAQTVVLFCDHTLSGPAPSEAEARDLLKWMLFDSLVERVTQRVKARHDSRARLEKERDLLAAQLRGQDEARRVIARQEMDRVLAELVEAAKGLDLRHLADDFDAILLEPAQHVRLERTTLALDGMGVMCDARAEGICHALEFHDLIGRDRRRWTVMLVCCHPRPDAASMSDRLNEANRWLDV